MALPLIDHKVTYNLAQVVRWLDAEYFAVGRWDGTMGIFDFETAPGAGPVVKESTESPTGQGLRMITKVTEELLVTSNDASSLATWHAVNGWRQLRLGRVTRYDAALGPATSGLHLGRGSRNRLVVGHDGGFVTIWSVDGDRLRHEHTLDLRNPAPVNPWDLHTVYDLAEYGTNRDDPRVVCGADDGYLSIIGAASGRIFRQQIFNPAAQRGINGIAVDGDRLLVANCSVGADDSNLWYFTIDPRSLTMTLRDKANLIVDPAEVQSFNFDVIWARHDGKPCWLASTEEGYLWMGTTGDRIEVLGMQSLDDGAIGAALAYAPQTHQLTVVIHNLQQFILPA